MNNYVGNHTIKIQNVLESEKRLFEYFESYNFQLIEDGDHKTFLKKGSLLSGWILNPLDLESEVDIVVSDDEINITYLVEGAGFGFLSPMAFSSLYQSFITNLELYLNNAQDYKGRNAVEVRASRNLMLKYLTLLLLGTLLGAYAAYQFAYFLDLRYVAPIGTICCALITRRFVNSFVSSNNNRLAR